MFQFSGFAFLSEYYLFKIVGCPIQVSADQFVCANPRSFSQLITPFFASESLGIPHTPLFCLLYSFKDAMNCVSTNCVINYTIVFFLLFKFSYLNMSMNFQAPSNSPFGGETVFWIPPLWGGYEGLLVENNGVEPLASCVQGRRSSQLS